MTIRPWILAARIPTLPAAVVPLLVGTATAVASTGPLHWGVFTTALGAALLIQIATNLINDLFDYLKGADTEERTGPVRVTTAGLLTPQQVARGIGVTIGLSILLGVYLVSHGGWPILLVGIASITCAFLYTAGPWPLAYIGLGDLFAFTFFGPVAVVGTHYLHTGSLDHRALLASIPVGLLVDSILIVNNLRDIPTDSATGKRTLAVRIGDRATRWHYTLFTLGAFTIPIYLWIVDDAGLPILLPLLTLLPALGLSRTILRGARGRELNPVLRGTGQLHLGYGILLTIGLLLR